MAKYCTNCGVEITENQKFCTNCGASLVVDSITELQEPAPVEVPIDKSNEESSSPIQETTVIEIVENSQALNRNDIDKEMDEIRAALMPKEKKVSGKTIGIIAVCALVALVAGLMFLPKLFTKSYEKPVVEVVEAWKDIAKAQPKDIEKSLKKTIQYSIPDDVLDAAIAEIAKEEGVSSLDELISEGAQEIYNSFENINSSTELTFKGYELNGSSALTSDELNTAKSRYKDFLRSASIPFNLEEVKKAYRVNLTLKYDAYNLSSSQKLKVITYQYKNKYYIDYLGTVYEFIDDLNLGFDLDDLLDLANE